MRMKPTIAAAAIAIAIGVFALRPDTTNAQQAAAKPQGPPPAPVEVAEAATSEIAAVQWVPGSVMARDDARIASELAGRIVAVADVGERIEKGDVIARLDDEALRLAVREAESSLSRIDAQRGYQARQLERLTQLKSRSSIAETQLDEARSQHDMLAHDRARAAVAVEESKRRVREATIRAPFTGIVAARETQLGEYIQPGATVVRLVNTERLEVRAQAPVSLGATLRAGDAVTLRDGARSDAEQIRAVVPVGDAQSRQLEVRIAVDDSTWPVGAAIEVALPIGSTASVVAVPRDALILRGRETFVFKVGADNKAERVSVETGSADGAMVEVKGAIVAGDRLVVRGAERLQQGQALEIRTARAEATPEIARSEP
ncbi:MAG TPA: efflux RND transporter periplasmic adaptor subunit [Candidatus Saccharimonadia bacterium]|nr:efflux RND transporter periplasmic adaptor subunit [Candidatus Saccharimonadia bacterium]